jgi:CRISPR-associated protein Cas5d
MEKETEMKPERSRTMKVRVRGPMALFTRPEFKTERVSYDVPTPSAMRGVVDAILWKPGIKSHIEKIQVLNLIKTIAFRRNEVYSKAILPSNKTVQDGGDHPPFYANDRRVQRNTLALRDVDYVIEFSFTMTDKAGSGDNIRKFEDMFERRITNGQCYRQPFLGCREFDAEFMPVDENTPQPIQETMDLGYMLWDIEFDETLGNKAIFFNAKMVNGIIDVPYSREEILVEPETVGGKS